MSESFSTASDEQQRVNIHVLQGEKQLAQHNESLGIFFNGIASATLGVQQIEVIFYIDDSVILSVTAKDKSTSINYRRGCFDITQIRRRTNGKANATENKEKSDQIEIKNQAEVLCYQTKKKIEQLVPKITKDEKKNLDFLIKDLKDVQKKEDFADMRTKIEELTKSMGEIEGLTHKEAGEATNVEKGIIDAEFSVEE